MENKNYYEGSLGQIYLNIGCLSLFGEGLTHVLGKESGAEKWYLKICWGKKWFRLKNI